MNSDLVYKKKYLKYKSKYTTLQRQLNVQEGGFSFSAIKPSNVKSGIYLFFVTASQDYAKLKDSMGLPMELFLRDSGVEISNKLGASCYYAEQKIDIKGKLLSALDGMKNIDKVKLELKQCSTGISTIIQQIEFTGRTISLELVNDIASVVKKQISTLNFYFIVDYNARTSNRISCLNPIPQMQQVGQYSAPPPQATAPLLEQQPYQLQQQQQQYQQQQPGQYPQGAPPPGYGAPPAYGAPPPGYGAPPPGYGAPPQGAYGAPPPQATAPLDELSQQQLAQLKPKYSNLSDLQLQQGWQQYKSSDPNISSQDFVYRMLQPSA